MKPTCSFLSIGLFLLCLSCKHPAEPDPVPAPPVSSTVTSPPSTSLTSTTYTIPTSIETAYADVPQPPADCRIVKMTYKGVNLQGPVVNPESVTIDGKTFQVSTQYTITYQYDSQRRLMWQRRLFSTGQPDSTQYIYSLGQVMAFRVEYSQPDKKYYRDTTAYPVDARGYPRTVANRQEVDTDGFILNFYDNPPDGNSTKRTVKNMNVITQSSYISGGFGTLLYSIDYYTTRPDLPSLTPFINRRSRNLGAKLLLSASGSTFWKDGLKFQEKYVYAFDTIGRIKRQVTYGFSLDSTWGYQTDNDGIGVTDYEYAYP